MLYAILLLGILAMLLVLKIAKGIIKVLLIAVLLIVVIVGATMTRDAPDTVVPVEASTAQ